ncbi:hypothetical protein ACFL5A_02535 [Gemmatimonadota bacterium]
MTHSLHRFGRHEDLTGDYIVFAMPARGLNDSDAVETEREFLRRALRHRPVNIGDAKKGGWYQPQKGLGPTVHWRRDTSPDAQRVIDGIDSPGIVAAVFDSYAAMTALVRELKELDLGISINISALAGRAADCCGECGITRHSVEYSLGFQGRTDRLPEKDVLELSTMCGHGTISFGLAGKMLERVRTGRRTPEEAARTLARFCVCSIFNPARAEEILQRGCEGMKGETPSR